MSSKGSISVSKIALGVLAAVSAFGFFTVFKRTQDQAPIFSPKNLQNETQASTTKKEETLSLHQSNDLNTVFRLQQQAKEKFSLGDTEEVFDLIELALAVIQDIGKAGTENEADVYFDLGFYYFHEKKITQAQEAFSKAYEIYEKVGQDEKSFEILDLMALTYENDEMAGTAFYEKVFQKKKEKSSPVSPGLAKVHLQEGLWHLRHSRDAKGLQSLNKAAEILKKAKSETKEEIGALYRQLMTAYKEAREVEKALQVANKVLEFLHIEKHPDILEEMATLYSEANNLEKSLEYHEKYLKTLKDLGKSKGEIGQAIQKFTTELEKKKDDEKAVSSWREFSNIFGGSEHKETAILAIYGNLRAFALYNRRNKVSEARQELGKAVAKTSELLGETHPYTLSLKKALALYHSSGQGEKPKLDVESLSLILIALEDNLQKLIESETK